MTAPIPTFESFLTTRAINEAADITPKEVMELLVSAFKSKKGFEVTSPTHTDVPTNMDASLDYAVGSLTANVFIQIYDIDGKKITGEWGANGENGDEEQLDEKTNFNWTDAGKLCKEIAKLMADIGDEVA